MKFLTWRNGSPAGCPLGLIAAVGQQCIAFPLRSEMSAKFRIDDIADHQRPALRRRLNTGQGGRKPLGGRDQNIEQNIGVEGGD